MLCRSHDPTLGLRSLFFMKKTPTSFFCFCVFFLFVAISSRFHPNFVPISSCLWKDHLPPFWIFVSFLFLWAFWVWFRVWIRFRIRFRIRFWNRFRIRFRFWQSYFIKLFAAGLQCEFIRTFYTKTPNSIYRYQPLISKWLLIPVTYWLQLIVLPTFSFITYSEKTFEMLSGNSWLVRILMLTVTELILWIVQQTYSIVDQSWYIPQELD